MISNPIWMTEGTLSAAVWTPVQSAQSVLIPFRAFYQMFFFKNSVVTIVANSSFKLANAVA